IRPRKPNITEELSTVYRNGALPEVQQDSLQAWRSLKHQRPFLAKIHIAHCINDVGVRCRDQRFRVQPFFPNWEDVVGKPPTWSLVPKLRRMPFTRIRRCDAIVSRIARNERRQI